MGQFQHCKLEDLPYDFNALEPVISAEIMTLHYTKHHQTYVNNFNKAVDQFHDAETKGDYYGMAAQLSAINFNGGGNINHSIFWKNLSPQNKNGGKAPKGEILQAINKDFGSLQSLVDQMSAKAIGVQGSGWAWLGYDKALDRLALKICQNQDPLISKGLIPLLGIDVWEHAYYLQYKNVRADYVKAIWSIINWEDVAERYMKAKS
jgi:superoxide dismutase, Fe-Mn family